MKISNSPYLCSTPQVPQPAPANETNDALNKAAEEKELARARARGTELIKELETGCLYYIGGWWSYSFCHNVEVKQFHQMQPGRGGVPVWPPVEDLNVPGYVLGQYRGINDLKTVNGRRGQEASNQVEVEKVESKPTDLIQVHQKGDQTYLAQTLNHGTTCDLTGRSRRIEVQYHCSPAHQGDRIGWIKEVSTCSYMMIIYTQRLCGDVAFQPPPMTKAHQIVCKEILAEDQVSNWKARKAEEVAKLKSSQGQIEAEKATTTGKLGEPKSSKGPMIGDIELGGQKTVGMPGKRIEPPKRVLPKEENAEVIALFDPDGTEGEKVQMVSKEILEELGLQEQAVKSMIDEMVKREDSRGWRIEVAPTQDGMELRGVFEEEEEGRGQHQRGKQEQGKKAGAKQNDGAKSVKKAQDAERIETAAKQAEGDLEDDDTEDDRGSESGSEEVFKDEL